MTISKRQILSDILKPAMAKMRLTITIAPEIVSHLDKLIDGKTIRNRSHAIESLINQQLTGHIHQAVILAGGGQDAIHRALTPVAGQPVISHTINLLNSHGIEQIYIITDQSSAQLDAIIHSRTDVTLIKQPRGLGTAGALTTAKHLFTAAPVIVMHGDIFTDLNLLDFIRFHRDHGQEVTIAVKPKLNQKEFGKAIMSGHRITRFLDKPIDAEVGMVNIGVYIINPGILHSLAKHKPLMLETDVFPQLADQNLLAGYLFEGIWYDISAKP